MLQLIITNKKVINGIINRIEDKYGVDDKLTNISRIVITNDIRFFVGDSTTAVAVYYLGTTINTYINNVINNKVDMQTKINTAKLAFKCDDQLFG